MIFIGQENFFIEIFSAIFKTAISSPCKNIEFRFHFEYIHIYIFLDIAKNNRRHDQRQICVVYIELYYMRIVKQEKITREEEREKKEMFLDKSEKFIHDVVREWLRWSWCKIVEGPRGRGLVSETSRQLKRHEKTRWAEFITH